jgi:hypothetical protein
MASGKNFMCEIKAGLQSTSSDIWTLPCGMYFNLQGAIDSMKNARCNKNDPEPCENLKHTFWQFLAVTDRESRRAGRRF